jgi:hypothetical protein
MTRADICSSDDYETRDRLVSAIRELGGRIDGEEWAIGVGLTRFRIGAEELSVFTDAWFVDIAGPDELVKRVLAAMAG